MAAYYNEIDPFAAAWLRELIKREMIAPGDVDERSIADVQPDDVRGYTQCHFFAGIGVWSYALFNAGWADTDPVWTGSCPCQPFSAAGKGKGFNDPRHLWPHFYRLISECRPDVVFGEQVDGPAGLAWLDAVFADLEASNYACGAVPFPAASVGAPHQRHRLYWLAESACQQRNGNWNSRRGWRQSPNGRELGDSEGDGWSRGPDDGNEGRRERASGQAGTYGGLGDTEGRGFRERRHATLSGSIGHADRADALGRLDDADDARLQGHGRPLVKHGAEGRQIASRHQRPIGFWDDADWLPCTDGKARPVEPGTFPLAHGSPARLGRLRGYGNAICAPQAQAFIEAYLDVCENR